MRSARTPKKKRAVFPPLLTDQEREILAPLLESVPEGAGEDNPELVALLSAWWDMKLPYYPSRVVPAYRCRGGEWLMAPVPQVLAGIRKVVDQ